MGHLLWFYPRPIRQRRLAQRLREITGKRYGDSALRYHLKPLVDAGLVRSFMEGDVKYIYREMDICIYGRKLEPASVELGEAPRTPEETREKLRAIFAKRRERKKR
jgi:DNA-binding transcriptional ArsR family regulator